MNWTTLTTRTIDLGYEQLLTLEGRPGTRVRVLYGAMWLTEEGDLRDVFAHCGEEVTLGSGGRSVIEGIGAARVQVIEPRRPSVLARIGKRLAHVWEAMWASQPARDAFGRSALMVLAFAVSAAVLHVAVPGPLTMHAAPVVTQAQPQAQAQSQARWQTQSQAQPQGTFATVLDSVASARTGFVAVN